MTPDRYLIVTLTDEMHKALRVRSAELGRPMSAIVRELLQGWLDGRIQLSTDEPREQEQK